MQQARQEQNQFVIDLMCTLRTERFRPLGWWHFLLRSWEKSCTTANNNPTLRCSWIRYTLLTSVLTLSICLLTLFFEGISSLLHLLPGFVFCVVWQQSDLFWHLGLNRQVKTGRLLQGVGVANMLTGLRGVAAAYLLGRLIGGITTSSTLALAIFLSGVFTDILDGYTARYTNTQSKLGQIIDGEADFCLSVALTLILLQNGLLPLWIALTMVLRFFIPLSAALVSYFLFAYPVRFGSTHWGKYAGFFQCIYFLGLLLPAPLYSVTSVIQLPLLITTLLLLFIAPIAQLFANIKGNDAWKGLLG